MARSKDFLLSLAALAKEGNETAAKALESIGSLRQTGAMFDADALRTKAGKMLKTQARSLLWGEIRGEIAEARRILLETAADSPSPSLESDLDGIFSVSVRNIRKGKEKVPAAFSPEGEALRAILVRVAPGGEDYDNLPDPSDD